jgi:hypothetical protein
MSVMSLNAEQLIRYRGSVPLNLSGQWPHQTRRHQGDEHVQGLMGCTHPGKRLALSRATTTSDVMMLKGVKQIATPIRSAHISVK